MELSPIRPNPPAVAPARPENTGDVTPDETPQVDLTSRETAPPTTGVGIDIETTRHDATGVTITNIVSHETGEVISQFPLERVLDQVSFLLQQRRTHEQ